eukprot:CAMPEP_0118696734 /NCGR_PEP_ID=MMETSP0800-20121206/14037_1 /TAXON_ID=210618 ORGANISM="Striatella unipunctata, Strain CCMP2910" /NCGR_SAMPLE_ID=MMETSP0800 /ASSEMBLY_ACC=CAM_ASM_000638 /LENGTH=203 /DNA_ID=CAMNT_0006595931 /DNA_START=156 /DNA_END=770 /DNA_ORIENTATION=-
MVPQPREQQLSVEAVQINDVEYQAVEENHRDINLEHNKTESSEPQSVLVSAGLTSGVLSTFLLGPFCGLLIGLSMAHYTRKDGATGDVARAIGEVGLLARDKARLVDAKHDLAKKSTESLVRTWGQLKELDRKHHILEHLKIVLVKSMQEAVHFNRKYHVLENMVNGMGKCLNYLGNKANGIDNNSHFTLNRRGALAASNGEP